MPELEFVLDPRSLEPQSLRGGLGHGPAPDRRRVGLLRTGTWCSMCAGKAGATTGCSPLAYAANEEGARRPPLSVCVWLFGLGVAELAFGGLEYAGAVLVLALVAADSLYACLVALGQHGADFVDA